MTAASPKGLLSRTGRIFLASVASYNVASLALWLQPVVVSDYVASRGFDPSEAGLLASAEMVTVAVAMMLISRFAPNMRFLPVALAGLALTLGATAGCLVVEAFVPLLLLRVVVALGFALLMLVPTMALAGLPSPQALYGRMYTISLIVSAILLALLPWITTALGSGPGFKALILSGFLWLPLLMLMPADAAPGARLDEGARAQEERRGPAIPLLAAGVAVLAVAYSAVWAFFMVFAGRAGLSPAEANTATALCLVAAMTGSLLSPLFGKKLGPGRAICTAAMLVGAGLVIVILARDPMLFRLGGALTLLSFYLLFPAVLGAAALLDPSGKGAAAINASMILLAAIGPYLGGVVMTEAGPVTMAAMTLIAATASVILFARFGAIGGAARTV